MKSLRRGLISALLLPVAAAACVAPAETTTASPGGNAGGGPRATPIGSDDVGTGTQQCTYSRNQAPTSFASTLGTDLVAKYVCPGCQTTGGATSSDFASKGLWNADSNPVIELIYWGTAWQKPSTSPSSSQVTQAFRTILASTYFDGLKQYGVQSVRLDQVVIEATDPPSPFVAGDVKGMVASLTDNTSLFSNRTDNTVFLVIMPPGAAPPATACGSHGINTWTNWGQVNAENVGWAAFSNLDSITASATHELVEAITNPHGSSAGLNAWTMERAFDGGSGENELGDACNSQEDSINGVLVQSYWSNTDRACIIPFPVPRVTGAFPTSGPAGTVVTITGTNLGGNPAVFFGNTPSPSVSCASPTQCTAVTPAGAGPEAVTVQSDYGSATAGTFCTPLLPASCPTLGADCGPFSDQCGGTVNCGTCAAGQHCGWYYNPNWCVADCTPGDCTNKCGETTDGCGAPLSCGGCGSGQTCVSGVCEGVVTPQCPVGFFWNGTACVTTHNCGDCAGIWPHCKCL